MFRRLHALLLLAVLLWQPLAMLVPTALARQGIELAHLIGHGHGEDHHHHDDGALHTDHDAEKTPHSHMDSGATPAGLLSSLRLCFINIPSASPAEVGRLWRASPDLEGPLRPPMQTA